MIFVFSGTGNSYSAAKTISEALGVGMVDLAKAVRYERYKYDAGGEPVGFVFPTYCGGLPSVVREFAANVSVANPGKVFAVATCAGSSGGACDMLQEVLGDRLRVDAMHDVRMPNNAVIAFDVPTKEQAAPILQAADAEIGEICRSLRAGETGDMRRHRGSGDWRREYEAYDRIRSTEPFSINDRCIECRICEDVCPEQAIKVYHRKPVWDEERCSLCMCCINLCPKAAIQYGEGTEERGRYFNPCYYERSIGIPLRYRRPAPEGSFPAPRAAPPSRLIRARRIHAR